MEISEYTIADDTQTINFISKTLEEIYQSPAKNLDDIKDITKNFLKFWIAKDKDNIVGTIGLKKEGKYFRLARMYQTKKTIGKKLVKEVIKYCKTQNIPSLFLTSHVALNATDIYEELGFVITKEEFGRVWMELTLQ
jgi:N-acetylglutamate synthase-like GNAT family acetyltransferase